jgi:hypothetical protein
MGVGNPLALHRGGTLELSSWTHKTIFNYFGLVEILQLHGLRVVQALGSGYYPLPASLGRLDVRHSHFIALKAIKVTDGGLKDRVSKAQKRPQHPPMPLSGV